MARRLTHAKAKHHRKVKKKTAHHKGVTHHNETKFVEKFYLGKT